MKMNEAVRENRALVIGCVSVAAVVGIGVALWSKFHGQGESDVACVTDYAELLNEVNEVVE